MPRPWIIVHCLMSVDARLTTARRLETHWEEIAPTAVHEYYRLARHLGVQGILTSASLISLAEHTLAEQDIVASDPRQLAPAVIVPDNRGRINWTLIKRKPWFRSAVALCSKKTPKDYLEYLDEEGIHYIVAGEEHVDLEAALDALWERYRIGMLACLGGAQLTGALLRRGLIDEISVVIAPLAIGGITTPTLFEASDLSSLQQILRLRLSHFMGLEGGAVWLRYEVIPKE